MERIDAAGLSSFGKGAIRQLPAGLKKISIRRALVVADRFLCEAGMAERVGRVLLGGNTEYAIYYQVRPNPTIQVVNECLIAARTLEVDILVAVGGSSTVDTAKAVNTVTTNGGSVEDCEGASKSAHPGIPIVAVNATAGTGSEVTSFYIMTDTEKHSKMTMADTDCMVRIAINDIDFMMSISSRLTASTGIDALTHVLGAVLLMRATSFMDKNALWAIGTIYENLPRAVSDGGDKEARTMMAYAEYAAGMAFPSAGLGMVHAVAHALGGRYNLPHGVCNTVLLPYISEYSGAAPEARIRFKKITKAMRLEAAAGQITATYGSSPGAQTVSTVIEIVRQLSQQVGIPRGLNLLEPVRTEDFHILTELAMKGICMAGNTIRPTLREVIQVYHHAYQGR